MKINLHNLAASIRTLLGNVQTHLSDNSKHVSTDDRSSWNNKTDDSKIASSTELGHVKVGDNLTIGTDGKLHASAASVPIATTSTPGLVKPNGNTLTVDSTGTLQIPTASDTKYGVTLLYNGVTSNALDKAATANSVKMVNDAKANKVQEGWTPCTLGTAWSNVVGTLSYYKDEFNVVHIRGAVSVSSTGRSELTVLPVDYRPAGTIYDGCFHTLLKEVRVISVYNDGKVTITDASPNSAIAINISYRL